MSSRPATPAARRSAADLRAVVYQALVFLAIGAGFAFLALNLLDNLEQRSIRTGFDFLTQPAGFDIGDHLIEYDGTHTYARALFVGLLNTLTTAAAALLLSTLFGTVLGIARLSRNPLLSGFAGVYVELVRNIPLLLQLFLWYAVLTAILPPVQAALELFPGVYLSKNGVNFPLPVDQPAYRIALAAFGAAIAIVISVRKAVRHSVRTGAVGVARLVPILIVAAPIVAFWFAGGKVAFEMPQWRRFRFAGGGEWSPELTALLLGLTLYSTAFIAEIVRSGIQSVAKGQRDAAVALGLTPGQALRLVILPQAARVAIPPLGSQYLNIVKNSSLAVAVGYPDLMSVANTALNQTGQALEIIGLTTLVYLSISLVISLGINWYNARTMGRAAP